MERLWHLGHRLLDSIVPINWRVLRHTNHVDIRLSDTRTRRHIAYTSPDLSSVLSTSSRISKPRSTILHKHRPVSQSFIRLLKTTYHRHKAFRSRAGRAQESKELFRKLLDVRSERLGALERVAESGRRDTELDDDVGRMDYPRLHQKFRKRLNQRCKPLVKLGRERKAAFEKLYQSAQDEIDHVPSDDEGLLYQMPEEFFETLQRTIDARRIHASHTRAFRQIQKDFVAVARKAKPPSDEGQAGAKAVETERTTTLQAFEDARMEKEMNGENLGRWERALMLLVQPLLTEREVFESAAKNVVARGAEHKPLVEAELNKVIESTPRTREDLSVAHDVALKRIEAMELRHKKLDDQYEIDLERYLTEDSTPSRTAFDRQFFVDRNQAREDIAIARRCLKKIEDLMKAAKAKNLDEMTSEFGSISGDGYVESMGSPVVRYTHLKRRLDRPHIEYYLSHVDVEGAKDPFEAKSPPAYEHDLSWDGQSIDTADLESRSMVDYERRRNSRQRKQLDRARGRPA